MEFRIFRRKTYDTIADWKRRKNGSTALLIKGARRVGKSIDVFCEKYSSRFGRPVMLYTKDLQTDGNMVYLPVYMASLL